MKHNHATLTAIIALLSISTSATASSKHVDQYELKLEANCGLSEYRVLGAVEILSDKEQRVTINEIRANGKKVEPKNAALQKAIYYGIESSELPAFFCDNQDASIHLRDPKSQMSGKLITGIFIIESDMFVLLEKTSAD